MTRILCVSHEWNLGFDTLRSLTDANFHVTTASSGGEAIRHFTDGSYDAVIVNRRLPDMPLCDLLNCVKNHAADLPVIMISNVMPVPEKPERVNAVIGRHYAAELLVPMLVLLLPHHAPAAADDTLLQSA